MHLLINLIWQLTFSAACKSLFTHNILKQNYSFLFTNNSEILIYLLIVCFSSDVGFGNSGFVCQLHTNQWKNFSDCTHRMKKIWRKIKITKTKNFIFLFAPFYVPSLCSLLLPSSYCPPTNYMCLHGHVLSSPAYLMFHKTSSQVWNILL